MRKQMATTRTTRPKPAAKAAPSPATAAAKPARKAAKATVRKPKVEAAAPVEAEPVTPVVAIEAAADAAPQAALAVAEPIETAAAEAPSLVEAAAEPVAVAAETAAATVRKSVTKTAKAGKAATAKAVKAGTEKITKTFEQAFSTSKEKYETAMQNLSDISAMGRENMDAVVSASTVFAKGVEAVNAELAAISKRNLEDSIAAVKALAAAKSAKEYFELQSDLMKTSWDHMVADTTKIGEMVGEYSKDAMAPIQSRITAAMEKFSKPLAV
jgi:phasin family protein